ncbi:hypothetical protein DASC09_048510 [Saccharomycopsis crataegensis]|uniref:Uncharacterized protein n=1 Tax=Saccharomycopsis crataegensis TaxID=43959 RepID=A0AAV5QS33_9ASCO|nr:hypothetical protein DASC09_048510 [Saccharomycopsis crataegensis]
MDFKVSASSNPGLKSLRSERSFKDPNQPTTMKWEPMDLPPVSPQELQSLRNQKYMRAKNKQSLHDNNILLGTKPSKLDMFDDKLTSFAFAPPPSSSISNMEQILTDSSNVDISFESNDHLENPNKSSQTLTGLIANLTENLMSQSSPKKRRNTDLLSGQEPKVVMSRNDPIVLIEDYIPGQRPSRPISVMNLKKSIFDLKQHQQEERPLKKKSRGNLAQEYLDNSVDDALKITYNSIRSMRSFPQYSADETSHKKPPKKTMTNKRSLMYLNKAIKLLDCENIDNNITDNHSLAQFKSVDFQFNQAPQKNNENRTISNNSLMKDSIRSVSSSTDISIHNQETRNPSPIDNFRLSKEKHSPTISDPNSASYVGTNSMATTPENPCNNSGDFLGTNQRKLPILHEERINNIAAASNTAFENLMLATSSRNNSFDSSAINKKRSASVLDSIHSLVADEHDASLKYCMICDKPLYDLSSLIQDGCKFKIFVCDNCTDVYNEIAELLHNIKLEVSNSDAISTRSLSSNTSISSELRHDFSSMTIDRSQVSDDNDDNFNEDYQLVHLAELVALELSNNNPGNSQGFQDSTDWFIEQNGEYSRNVKMYEKILKLVLLLNNGDDELEDPMESSAAAPPVPDESVADGDTTTDIGNETARTFALDPNAGFEAHHPAPTTQVNTNNILQDINNFPDSASVFSKSSLRTRGSMITESIILPKQRRKNRGGLINKNAPTPKDFQEYYRSLITKPSTTRLLSTALGKENQMGTVPFSNDLVGTLQKQLDSYTGSHAASSNISSFVGTPTSKDNNNNHNNNNGGSYNLLKYFHASPPPQADTASSIISKKSGANNLTKHQSLLNLNLEQEWSTFKKKFRWRWRVKGLMPGVTLNGNQGHYY